MQGALVVKILRSGDEGILNSIGTDVFDDPIDAPAAAAFLAGPRHHLELTPECILEADTKRPKNRQSRGGGKAGMNQQNSAASQSPPKGANVAVSGLAAIGGVLAATSCCLPVFPFLLAAGTAGTSAFLSAARPYLLAASILFIAYGFYQTWRTKKCERKPSVLSSVLLWTSTVIVIVSILFPEALANLVASLARN